MSAPRPPRPRKPDLQASDSSTDWVLIGSVGRPHGLRGAFFVSGRDDRVPAAYKELRIGDDPASGAACAIVRSYLQSGRPALIVDLAADRTAAEELVGRGIWVERRRLSAARRPGELLWDDLEQAAVVDAAGTALGRVAQVYATGANDVAEVRRDDEAVGIPLVEAYVDFERSGPQRLVLTVTADVFADAWYSVRSDR